MSSFGYNNRILMVNLSSGEIGLEHPGDAFYRRYVGGANLGAYYLLKNWKKGIGALDPENTIVFAASPLTGTPVPGFSRHSVVSVSPLTGTIVDSEAGGYFGPELKKAGYDAVVITGKAKKPVYLAILDDKVELKSAENIWGRVTKEAEMGIRKDLKEDKAIVTQIGPAGENLVSFACIVNNLKHFNGRGGLGAVMGSKNLKAIAVRGSKKVNVFNEELLREKVKSFAGKFKDNPFNNLLNRLGTAGVTTLQNTDGQLPTKNFQTGVFSKAENLSGEKIHETIFHRAEACYACSVRCKMTVSNETEGFELDPAYGGPEYEGISALGPYTEIGDLLTVAKANEMCNKYGLDAVSMGSIAAFAMECYEKGLITKEEAAGIELVFGNNEALIQLIKAVKERKGIGNLLADGIRKAAEKMGKEAEKLAVHVKGMDFAAHDPRAKVSFGLAYAVQPIGPDHIGHFGDPGLSPDGFDNVPDQLNSFGFYDTHSPDDLDLGKAAFFYYGQMINSFHDVFDICTFTSVPGGTWELSDILELIKAITGWNYSAWELMKLGERRVNMLKVFNVLNGIGAEEDRLPPRMFEPFQSGPRKGAKIEKEALEKTIKAYYQVAGWDSSGVPGKAKLIELGLGWLSERLEKKE